MNYRKALLLWSRRLQARSAGAKRVENGVNAIQKWVPFTPKCRPQIARESLSKLASLTRRVGKGVNGIQKWVPFTPKCSQKRWWLGLRPRPPIVRESAFGACQSDTPSWKRVLPLFKNGFLSHQNALRNVGGWGSAPDPQIVRESGFDACQSDMPREGVNSHLCPGRQKPLVRHRLTCQFY